jgi:hypothetical protein
MCPKNSHTRLIILFVGLFLVPIIKAGPRDYVPATVVSMDSSDDEILKPRSHMVKECERVECYAPRPDQDCC